MIVRRAALVALVSLALVGAGCTSSKSKSDTSSASTATLSKDCNAAACTGQRDGAKYEIKLPAKDKWNGTLLIWSHGYRNAGPIPTNPLDASSGTAPVDTSAEAGPEDSVDQTLLGQGYALAGSAFKTNGWDVQDGVAAGNDLYKYFADTFGKPKRVYIWGGSLGGLITQTLAETKPSWLSGAAPLCGVLGGTNLNLDLALDVAYGVKELFYPQLKLSGFTSQAEAVAQWQAASKAIATQVQAAKPAAIAGLVAIASIAGAPSKTKNFDGHDPTSLGGAYVEAVVTALGYGTWGRYDLEQRVGGNPSQNTGTDYSKRITPLAEITINTAAPGQLTGVLKKLADGKRLTADAAARTKADQLGNPQGDLAVPTLTLHTIDDPLVISQNETVFAQRVAAKNKTKDLVQMFTTPPTTYTSAPYGAGHCNFTADELQTTIKLLDGWVRSGTAPNTDAQEKAFDYDPTTTPGQQSSGKADNGYTPNTKAQDWPAAT